nr:hypothetical protein [Tanacetum cinerariifolium]
AYESDKIILDTYEDIVTLKRRRDDDADKDEELSVGSDRGPRGEEKERSQSQQALQRKEIRTTGNRKYTTSITKTNAADYGHIKWVEDLVTRTMWSQELVRIIVVTELKIVEWHNYKHLDWITVRRDDDKLYKFKEGNFKRLRIQDIEDMLLLLVQGKLTNLTVKERFAFNISLRMFTRRIVIQRHVEDLQLGVESYQKKLNLTEPDTYHFDLKR